MRVLTSPTWKSTYVASLRQKKKAGGKVQPSQFSVTQCLLTPGDT